MRIMIDTHILLWSYTNSNKLNEFARQIIADKNNDIYFSVLCLWEIELKHLKNQNIMPVDCRMAIDFANMSGFRELPLDSSCVAKLETLRRAPSSPPHNDPFDKMMLAQAKAKSMMFMSHDELLAAYNEPYLMLV